MLNFLIVGSNVRTTYCLVHYIVRNLHEGGWTFEIKFIYI